MKYHELPQANPSLGIRVPLLTAKPTLNFATSRLALLGMPCVRHAQVIRPLSPVGSGRSRHKVTGVDSFHRFSILLLFFLTYLRQPASPANIIPSFLPVDRSQTNSHHGGMGSIAIEASGMGHFPVLPLEEVYRTAFGKRSKHGRINPGRCRLSLGCQPAPLHANLLPFLPTYSLACQPTPLYAHVLSCMPTCSLACQSAPLFA